MSKRFNLIISLLLSRTSGSYQHLRNCTLLSIFLLNVDIFAKIHILLAKYMFAIHVTVKFLAVGLPLLKAALRYMLHCSVQLKISFLSSSPFNIEVSMQVFLVWSSALFNLIKNVVRYLNAPFLWDPLIFLFFGELQSLWMSKFGWHKKLPNGGFHGISFL